VKQTLTKPQPGILLGHVAINVPGVEGVDFELHPILIMEPLEELQIGQRLRFGVASVPVVDPREILGARRAQSPARAARQDGYLPVQTPQDNLPRSRGEGRTAGE
jgi:hypothetical protein